MLAGLALFFVLEKRLPWRHCHEARCPMHGEAATLSLLDNGCCRARAVWLNTLSSVATSPGAPVGYFWLARMNEAIGYILAISAAWGWCRRCIDCVRRSGTGGAPACLPSHLHAGSSRLSGR